MISQIQQPKDTLITLQSILDSGYTDKRKHTSLNTNTGSISEKYSTNKYLKNRNETTGMLTIIYDNKNFLWNDNIRTVNQNEMEKLHNIPKGYTSIVNQKRLEI